MLHDLVYRIVEEVCWDRDYLYKSFTGTFSGLMDAIYGQGGTEAVGSMDVEGIKSDVTARVTWRLQHQLDYFGPNALTLDWQIRRISSGSVVRSGTAVFDLATGSDLPT